ncbi:MAG: GtrA family protein [Bacilli bacterium]|nr:GtrA family protein [Bacilli bacterium]
MILVVLGTQDKEFPRLLKAVEKEIKKGNIKEDVYVQAGQTKYESDCMKIFDFVSAPEFEKMMNDADIIITHGGAGTILTAIKKGKKILATPRLSKYKEHHNDHQKQIIEEFEKMGYLLELRDFNQLSKMIEKIRKFKPKKFESNTNNMIKLIEEYINNTNHTAWYHKYKEILMYLVFGALTTLLSVTVRLVLFHTVCNADKALDVQIATIISNAVGIAFAYVTNRLFVFESKNKNKLKEASSFVLGRLSTLFMDMGIMFVGVTLLHWNETIITLISQVLVIVLNYIISKLFVFKKK